MIKSEGGIKRRGDLFWSVGNISFEKDTIGHISQDDIMACINVFFTLYAMYKNLLQMYIENSVNSYIRVITKLPNFEQSSKGKVKTHKYINRQNQSTCYPSNPMHFLHKRMLAPRSILLIG